MGSWSSDQLANFKAAIFTSEPGYNTDSGYRTLPKIDTAISSLAFTKTAANDGGDSTPYETISFNIPQGFNTFYVTFAGGYAAGGGDWSTAKLNGLVFQNVTIPEPAVLSLLVLGAGLLGGRRRR